MELAVILHGAALEDFSAKYVSLYSAYDPLHLYFSRVSSILWELICATQEREVGFVRPLTYVYQKDQGYDSLMIEIGFMFPHPEETVMSCEMVFSVNKFVFQDIFFKNLCIFIWILWEPRAKKLLLPIDFFLSISQSLNYKGQVFLYFYL